MPDDTDDRQDAAGAVVAEDAGASSPVGTEMAQEVPR